MKVVIPILFIITTLYITGCKECTGKQVTCPAFNNNVAKQWIPYIEGQQLIFTTSTGERDTIKITEVDLSASYQATVSARSPGCTAHATWYSNQTDSSRTYKLYVMIGEYNDQFLNSNSTDTYIAIKGGGFNGKGFSDTGLVNAQPGVRTQFYPSAMVGNQTFSHVQEAIKDTSNFTTKQREPYKFWIAKNQGIVAYEEYHGKLWIKQ
jgi:hypothetical protein